MIFNISNTSLELFPIVPLYCLVKCNEGEVVEVPREFVINGIWGRPTYFDYNEPLDLSLPEAIDVVYISILEKQAYKLEAKIDTHKLNNAIIGNNDTPFFVIGLGPYGIIAIWSYTPERSYIIDTFCAQPTDIPGRLLGEAPSCTINTVCNQAFEAYHLNLVSLNIIDKTIAFNLLKQYSLRYNWVFCDFIENDSKTKKSLRDTVKSLRIARFDGSFDYSNDGTMHEYHITGVPKTIFMEWETYKKSYYASIFLEHEIVRIFERFYGVHPETKVDFIIRIDAENKKYELSLYRQGLKEPVVIPESAYQLIVFKNKLEDYRSENYNQPRGAWIW